LDSRDYGKNFENIEELNMLRIQPNNNGYSIKTFFLAGKGSLDICLLKKLKLTTDSLIKKWQKIGVKNDLLEKI
jgi:hypothetical protein